MNESSDTIEDLASNDALINQLPDECLSHIFTFLPHLERLKVEQVCKRWCIIGERGWYDIKKLEINYKHSEGIIDLILKRCGSLRELSIPTSTKQLDYSSLVREVNLFHQGHFIENYNRFPNLRGSLLMKFTITGDECDGEGKCLTKFTKLGMFGRPFIPTSIIQKIGTLKNLQELSLGCNYWDITNEHIRLIARNCHKIKRMSLTRTPSMTSDCFQYLGGMLSLEDLELEYFVFVKSRDIVCLTNVKRLCFDFCLAVFESDGLIKLITHPSNLEALKLSRIRTLNITFANNVLQIFHSDQRVKPLRLELIFASDQERLHATRVKNDCPLLDLSVSFR